MRRRELIVDLSVAAILWPCAARAQQKAPPVIGFLSSRSPRNFSAQVAGFRQGLAEMGYTEGEDLVVEVPLGAWRLRAAACSRRRPGRQAGGRPRDRRR